MQLVWYTAMSMDGRIAGPGDDLGFLDLIGPGADSGADFRELIASVDGVLLGASTLRWLLRGGHGWPHDDLPTWLVSHDPGLVEQVGATRAPFRRREGALGGILGEMETAGHQRVWLGGGGDIAGQALALGRIDEVIVTVAPTGLGAGPALFDAAAPPANRFTLAECRAAGGDAARLRWFRER